MAGNKASVAGERIQLGAMPDGTPIVDAVTNAIRDLPPTSEVTSRAVVLVNERQKLLVQHPSGRYHEYQVSFYISRDPLDDGELDRIKAKAAEQEAAKTAREAKETKERQGAIQQAVKITQESERAAFARTASLQAELDMLRRLQQANNPTR